MSEFFTPNYFIDADTGEISYPKTANVTTIDYVCADPHFSHPRLFKFSWRANIFRDPDEYDEFMVNSWNKVVKKGQTVVIIGDYAYKDHAKWLNRLNGKKILVYGNHDSMGQDKLNLFTGVYPMYMKNIKGQEVFFFHYPCKAWPNANKGSWNLYGHTHGREREYPRNTQFDCGVDVWGYIPIPWEVVEMKMDFLQKLDSKYSAKGLLNETLARANLGILSIYFNSKNMENPVDKKVMDFFFNSEAKAK